MKTIKSGAGDFHRKSKGEKSPLAILLVDVINDFQFPEAEQLLKNALPIARNVKRLCQRARRRKIPIIYVNDNFGRWQSDFKTIVHYCLKCRGSRFVKPLVPGARDYFVLKPKHSGFFSTTLETLLKALGSQRLIITGVATNICVFFTANDAYMRDFRIHIPKDCVAANTAAENQNALLEMRKLLKANTAASPRIKF